MPSIFTNAFLASLNKTLSLGNRSAKKAKDLLTKEQNSILNAAVVLMLIVLVTKFTGLIFNSLSVGFLGVGPYNEFIFASNIPEIISASILLGAISASVIPALVQARQEAGHQGFLRVLNTLVNASLIAFTALALIISILAPQFMPWLIEKVIHPVTPPTQEEMDRMVMMMRVLLIPQVILGISTFLSSSLNVMQRFVVPQLAPLFYNFGRIIAILILIPIMGQSPWVLVYGTLLGAVFHLLIQIPLVLHLGIKYMPVLALKDKYFRNILNLGLPRVMGLSAEQMAVGVDRIIAYGLVDNSLAAYELAIRLIVIPMSLFGVTFSTAAFPLISRAYLAKNEILLKKTVTTVLNQIIFLALPVAVMLVVLRLPLTRLFYGMFGNSFTWDDTRKVAWVVMFFALGLTFETLRSFIFKTYYAMQNAMVPLYSAAFVVIGGIFTGILFTNYMSHFDTFSVMNLKFDPSFFLEKSNGRAGVGGLALSASLIYTLEAVFLLTYMNIKYLKIGTLNFFGPILKKILIAIATGVVAYIFYTLYNDVLDTSKTSRLIFLTFTTLLASMCLYIWLSYIFNVAEVELLEKLVSKLRISSHKKSQS